MQRIVNKRNEFSRKKFTFFEASGTLPVLTLREEHIARRFPSASAILPVKNHVIRQNIVALFESEGFRSSIDRTCRPFEFQKNADGCLVQLDQQPRSPGIRCRQAKRRPEFFVLEPAVHPQALKNSCQGLCVGDFHLDFFANFVALPLLARSGRHDRTFERDHRSQYMFPASAHWQLRSNAQQLLATRQQAFSRIEKSVTLMQARPDYTRAELGQPAPQPRQILNSQLDFSLFRQFFLNAASGQLFDTANFRYYPKRI